MATSLFEFIPDAEALLALEPEELGWTYLQYLRALPDGGRANLNRYNFTLPNNFEQYPPEHREDIARAVTEAWSWLEREGFLAPEPGKTGEWSFVTRRGMQVATEDDRDTFRRASMLPHKILHPRIAAKVYAQFLRGEYDVAVFQAFKEVEVAARGAAGLTDDLIGTKLMRKAFDPETGALADAGVVSSEREARAHLFAGAIGSYKNPHSHRDVGITEPTEAVELLFLASHLLRLVESATPEQAESE